MLDIVTIDKSPILYCNEKALITVAKYLNKEYGMAFWEMNGIEYSEKELPVDEKISVSYSQITIVKALRKYHGISCYFPKQTGKTIIGLIEKQIELSMPVLIFISNSICYSFSEERKTITFLVVGYDEEFIMGYDMGGKNVLITVLKEKIRKDYTNQKRVIIWKDIHEEVVLDQKTVNQIMCKLKTDKNNEVSILRQMIEEFEFYNNDIIYLQNMNYELLLNNLSDVVRGKKLFLETLKYLKSNYTYIEDDIIDTYIQIGKHWNNVWRMFAMLSVLVLEVKTEQRIKLLMERIITEIKTILVIEQVVV